MTEGQKGVLQPGEDQRANVIVFGQVLERWLEATGKKQNELAQALHVSDSIMSRRIAGERRLDTLSAVKILLDLLFVQISFITAFGPADEILLATVCPDMAVASLND